jgi:hypothetical protein
VNDPAGTKIIPSGAPPKLVDVDADVVVDVVVDGDGDAVAPALAPAVALAPALALAPAPATAVGPAFAQPKITVIQRPAHVRFMLQGTLRP